MSKTYIRVFTTFISLKNKVSLSSINALFNCFDILRRDCTNQTQATTRQKALNLNNEKEAKTGLEKTQLLPCVGIEPLISEIKSHVLASVPS